MAMRSMIAGLPAQLRWAAGLDLPEVSTSDGTVVVAGMGGSGVSGDLVAPIAAAAGTLVHVHKGYELPGWSEAVRPLLVAVSYSGNTEETISAVRAAEELGLAVAVVTTGGSLGELAASRDWPTLSVPGGLQPRAAVGYLFGAVMRVLEAAGVVPDAVADLTEAADVAEELIGADGHGPGAQLADDLAEALVGRVAVIYGSPGPAAPAALRWKTQINENAKSPAYHGLVPELDHNEIVGWEGFPELGRRHLGLVLLRDHGETLQVGRRFALTARLISDRVAVVGEVWSHGESLAARMLSLGAVGDLVSLAMAEKAGVDPVTVTVLDTFKREIGKD